MYIYIYIHIHTRCFNLPRDIVGFQQPSDVAVFELKLYRCHSCQHQLPSVPWAAFPMAGDGHDARNAVKMMLRSAPLVQCNLTIRHLNKDHWSSSKKKKWCQFANKLVCLTPSLTSSIYLPQRIGTPGETNNVAL